MRRTIIAALGSMAGAASLALLLAEGPAMAQPRDPTATDIIDALRPRPGQAQPATRGIRPVAPQATPAPATAPASAPATGDLRPVAPAAPATPAAPTQQAAPVAPIAPGAPVPSGPVPPVAEAPSISLNVLFAVNSAELTPQARRVLDELGRALTSADLSPYRFRIEGHTDTTGSADYNMILSERRAQAVRDYLVQQFGISRTRLETIGLGQTQLAVPTGDNVNEPRNRRVHIVNIGS
jgi:outer membrane protein OmpA-like peptidoglycan-associated protein